MRSKLALATVLAAAFVAPAAFPCGAPFGTGINVDPKQDIIVVHKNGVETYVFQPRFCGSAQEFGLILPIPAKLSEQPKLSNATAFSRLTTISQPTHTYTTMCGWPTAGTGGGSGSWNGADGGASVVSSGTVGFMDYAQLDAGSTTSLTTWLDANGYPYDNLAAAAFDYYVKKGWYFVAFKVNQGAIPAGTTLCKDLGPIKLSFASTEPIVPTRMATARSRDTSGVLSYASGFSWRVFGITAGQEQIGFGAGASLSRTLNYSGLLAESDIAQLAGLAVAGDRAVKLTLTFNYGATDPDVALAIMSGKDYHEVINHVSYIQCNDAAVVDAAPLTADASVPVDLPPRDSAPAMGDAGAPVADVGNITEDAQVAVPPESPGKADAGAVVAKDASPTVTTDAASSSPSASPSVHSSGCSFTGSPTSTAPLLMLALLLLRGRRRR